MKYDVIVIGSGPAGLSAAVNVRQRGGSVICIGTDMETNPLMKAQQVDNYLGFPGMSGKTLIDKFMEHAVRMGVDFMEERVLNAYDMGSGWMVSAGADIVEGYAIVFAGGVSRGKLFEGESDFIGKGVSYCTTCDGMLYRGRKTVVIGFAPGGEKEAEYLSSIGCDTQWMESPKGVRILGSDKVTGLLANGQEYEADCVFILRPSLAPAILFPSIKLEGSYIQVGHNMDTNLKGVYAAGDCTGAPFQVAKAVGEGLIAGQSAVKYAADLRKSIV